MSVVLPFLESVEHEPLGSWGVIRMPDGSAKKVFVDLHEYEKDNLSEDVRKDMVRQAVGLLIERFAEEGTK